MATQTFDNKQEETQKPMQATTSFIFAESRFEECRIILKMMVPITISSVSQFFPQAICFAFVGHLPNSTQLLAGAGLARIFTNVTATSFSWGITVGLQTLVPQAIGNNNKQNPTQTSYLIALYVQQCFFISVVILAPLTVLQFFSGSILTAIGQPSDLSPIIEQYCRALIPYLWISNILMIVNRTGRALMFNTEIMIIFIIGSFFSYIANYLLIDVLEYSYLWTAIALDLTQLFDTVLIICLLIYKGHGYMFKPLPFKDITRWKNGILTYLQLAVPALIQIASSWWITELIVLFTGFIRVDTSIAVGATAITTQINSFGKIISVGMSAPVAIRVGGYIGSGSVQWAKQSAKVAFLYLDIGLIVCLMVIPVVFRNTLPKMWTMDNNVIELVSDMLCIVSIFQLPFNLFFFIGCIYRGLGYPKYAAWILCFCQYCLSIPLNFILLFGVGWRYDLKYGALSIWSVITFGYSLATVVFITHLSYFVNWNQAVTCSKKRIERIMLIKPSADGKSYGSVQVTTKQ